MNKVIFGVTWLIIYFFTCNGLHAQICSGSGTQALTISGELRAWHNITFDFDGPYTDESCAPIPFSDYRLNVLFTHATNGQSYLVPGYFAADGDAAESGATGGNIWRCHFAPDEVGTWNYSVSFRTGTDIAVSLDPNAGTPLSFDGHTGNFNVSPTNKIGKDFRAHGLLEYVGERYLKFAGSGQYFLKGGADAPENFLAYEDFDNTPNNNNLRKSWNSHLGDWNPGDPDWQGNKGRDMIGALNYLAAKGMNAFSFLTMNIDGDDDNVFPYVTYNSQNSPQKDRLRFDVSKLAQWEIVFSHADSLGLFLHFKTQETENDQLLDQGLLGVERKLYYRELIARFGHHLALNWNLGEENDIWSELSDPTQSIVKTYARYIRQIDPYNHHIVIHSYSSQHNDVYTPFLGVDSSITGPSIQTGWGQVHDNTLTWINASEAAGLPWVVTNDEQGSASRGVPPDPGYNSYVQASNTVSQASIRRRVLWGNLMAGGAGVEYYFGYDLPQSDLICEDWRSRDNMWEYTDHALHFFQTYIPFWDMENRDDLVTSDYCFAKNNEYYVVYMEAGNTPPQIDLPAFPFELTWYDPRLGGIPQGNTMVTGTMNFTIPNSPSNGTEDWVAIFSPSALPLSLDFFKGERLENGAVQLAWESKDEENSSHYEIESSIDGRESKLVGQIEAKKNASTSNQYTFSTFSDDIFFRLKMVGTNGSINYSNWIQVEGLEPRMSLYPNPFSDHLLLNLDKQLPGSKIEIVDILGRVSYQGLIEDQLQIRINTSQLESGLYFLRITNKTEELIVEKIYKQ